MIVVSCHSGERNDDDKGTEQLPAVFLSMISRNEEHTLATYLGYIENLDYPKDRISIL